jgi:hypothetical protein
MTRAILLFTLLPFAALVAEQWPLEKMEPSFILQGNAAQAPGVVGQSLVLDGSSLIELKDSAALTSTPGFTVSIWFNPYQLTNGQQLIAAKNRYSLNEREWGIILEPDGHVKAYLRQGGWSTITCNKPIQAGHWHRVTLTIDSGKASLYLNGQAVGEKTLHTPIQATKAPITLGGINDQGHLRQTFLGALDELQIEPRAWTEDEITSSYHPVATTHELPASPVADFPVWDASKKLAEAKDLPVLEDVEFHVIKKWNKAADGYTFLHGVGLCWHRGKLYSSIGHNKGAENTVTEEAQYRVSADGGKTWGELQAIDTGDEPDLAVSHGVFLSHGGKLWAFHGAYYNKMERIHIRAYSLDESTGQWVHHGIVIGDGFWALNQPVKMKDGNWIMSGISAGPYSNTKTFPAAVAISHGDDFTKWDFVGIPVHDGLKMWGESSVIVDGSNVLNIARYGAKPLALVAQSTDYGRTWGTMGESNLPMTTSKPAAGMLSTGQRYLVCTNAANNGGKRYPLTIAISEPGKAVFSKVFVIRHADHAGPGESAPNASLSYPCATEHEGKLYVGFSNNGGRRGNLNSAEMAVIPLEKLQ